MPTFSLDLPFRLSLSDTDYAVAISGRTVTVHHAVVEQEALDTRLGGVSGTFGFEQDRLGLLRFSRLTFSLDGAELDAIGGSLLGRTPGDGPESNTSWGPAVAVAVCNRLIDAYRVAVRDVRAHPVGPSDPAFLRVQDGEATRHLRLYGGDITLPPAGPTDTANARILEAFSRPDGPAPFERAALDALHAADGGSPAAALVLAAGALESAVDVYLGRTWRLADPPLKPPDALRRLWPKAGKKAVEGMRTVDDVLKDQGIRAKMRDAAIVALLGPGEAERIAEALEARNLVVHGDVRMPVGLGKRHAQTLSSAVLDRIAPAIRRDCPALPRPDVFYALEEALGRPVTSEIQRVAQEYLVDAGLTARLYNQTWDTKHPDMVSEEIGDTVVMRIAFDAFEQGKVDLFVARALLWHSLKRQNRLTYALADPRLLQSTAGPTWDRLAEEVTRTVWQSAIDRRLWDLGFGDLVQEDAARMTETLRDRYSNGYEPPRPELLASRTEFLELARTAAVLSEQERTDLLALVDAVAPIEFLRVADALPALLAAHLGDPSSIRAALLAVHDAHEDLGADVAVFDPESGTRDGLGTKLNDLGRMLALQADRRRAVLRRHHAAAQQQKPQAEPAVPESAEAVPQHEPEQAPEKEADAASETG